MGTLLAWSAAVLYPFVLFVAVDAGHSGFFGPDVLVSAGLTVLVVALLWRRPLPALGLLLFAWTAALSTWPSGGVAIVQVLVTDVGVAYVAATRRPRVSLPVAAGTLTVQTSSYITFLVPRDVLVMALPILAMAVTWLVGNSVRVRRAHAETLREQALARAVSAERLRIARELHDMVAHSIGIIAIQAGVGGRVITSQPDEARNALDAIESTSRETLSGLRRMLTALRKDEPGTAPLGPTPGLDDLDRLAESARDAGVRVEIVRRGERRPLPPDVDLSAYRIVQEAVTNVIRHAGTDHCRVTVDHRDGELVIEVDDDGRGGVAGTGFGIAGMRERADLLGGELTAGPRPDGGFRVTARLPDGAATTAASSVRPA
ncbi:signal transduction histidine kinase [Actinomadura pelletieri DSM 43383]|uniref:histidine kinase n=2 Tax=Actinomadura pelletieri TaxID=111805 RepID=A0A495QHA6_9ACTN|nr:signal transduction histidine kinase [Actinomadura pelletieri DSM 43383]